MQCNAWCYQILWNKTAIYTSTKMGLFRSQKTLEFIQISPGKMIYSMPCTYIPYRCFHLWGTISSNSLGNGGLRKHRVGHQQTRLELKFLVGSLLLKQTGSGGDIFAMPDRHRSQFSWWMGETGISAAACVLAVKHNCPPAQKNGTICQQWFNTAPLWRDLV